MIAILLSSTMICLVKATPPTQVSGRLATVPGTTVISNTLKEGANVFADIYNKGTYLSGDILGSYEQTYRAVTHFANPDFTIGNPTLQPEAPFNFMDIERTFTGTVDGVSGGFTMRLQGTGYGNTFLGPTHFDVQGTWVIISGTGGLADLHGQGTWWHSRTGFAGLEYQGQIHFDP